MNVVVNGEPRELDTGARVAHVVAVLRADPTGSAVAVNGEVVPRSAWPTGALADGDRVEVLTAVQGG